MGTLARVTTAHVDDGTFSRFCCRSPWMFSLVRGSTGTSAIHSSCQRDRRETPLREVHIATQGKDFAALP